MKHVQKKFDLRKNVRRLLMTRMKEKEEMNVYLNFIFVLFILLLYFSYIFIIFLLLELLYFIYF